MSCDGLRWADWFMLVFQWWWRRSHPLLNIASSTRSDRLTTHSADGSVVPCSRPGRRRFAHSSVYRELVLDTLRQWTSTSGGVTWSWCCTATVRRTAALTTDCSRRNITVVQFRRDETGDERRQCWTWLQWEFAIFDTLLSRQMPRSRTCHLRRNNQSNGNWWWQRDGTSHTNSVFAAFSWRWIVPIQLAMQP